MEYHSSGTAPILIEFWSSTEKTNTVFYYHQFYSFDSFDSSLGGSDFTIIQVDPSYSCFVCFCFFEMKAYCGSPPLISEKPP